MVSFVVLKFFTFMRPHLLIVLTACANGFLFGKPFPVPVSSNLFLTFSSIMFIVSGFMLRSMIYLKLSFVQGGKNGSISISLHVAVNFDQHHLLKMFSLF